MAYSKPMPPPGHLMTKGNAVCCAPILEETQCSSEPLTWLEVLLKKLKLHSCCVVDIFGDCGECIHIIQHVQLYHNMLTSLHTGELAQVATLRKLECIILQPSYERVVAVCNILDNLHSDDCKFCEYTAAV